MNKKDNKPWYVKVNSFVIPSALKPLIEKYEPKEQKAFCLIVSKIIIFGKDTPKQFISIARQYWLDSIGGNYTKYITTLKLWQIIEINDSYSNAEGLNYCKSYRLHSSVVDLPREKITFKIQKIQPLADNSQIVDEQTRFIFDNLQKITTKETLVRTDNVESEVDCEQWAKKVWHNVFNMHYGAKCGRLYHSIIVMPKESRANLTLKADPNIQLYEYDVKSCAPVFLLTLCQDNEEKEMFKVLLDMGIYETIAAACGITKDRKVIKEDFNYFLNGGIQNYFHFYLEQHFPHLLKVIQSFGKAMAEHYQTSESNVMVKTIPTLVCSVDDSALYIPCHDGWMGIERDEALISKVVKEQFYNLTGYNVVITKKNLATGEETKI